MKYNYHVPASTYTRRPHFTPVLAQSGQYSAASRYGSGQYSSTHSVPSYYTPAYYTPAYTSARYGATRRTLARDKPAPVIPAVPAKKSVHFPNDIVFQDLVRRGELEQIVRFVRTRKVRVDALFPSGMAALHEAVLTGNLEVVKLLVKYGADVHQRDEDGWTPLHMACSDGFPQIASYLLSIGASKEAENESGEKPADLIDPDCTELAKLFEAARL
ncbi:protein phosphatase 1 regulatory subunit 27 [Nerophis ophidion]|uniref:protein phosphatase 1 regulatory subunit 27 n=1 Tax=Nerophis ophidion TaxID=159077 RepID=UPI002ADFF98E|nr:protein phosphatase 1 regulatory subunit 27 [Nerophis ophidion]